MFVCPSAYIISQNTENIAIHFGESARTVEAKIKVGCRKQMNCVKANWIFLAVEGNCWRFLAKTEVMN